MKVGHMWADWLLLLGERPVTLHNRRHNQNWAHMWTDWLHHPRCLWGRSTMKVAQMWADWLQHPSRVRGPQRLTPRDEIRSWPTCG